MIKKLLLLVATCGILAGCFSLLEPVPKVANVTSAGLNLFSDANLFPSIVAISTIEGRSFCSGVVISDTEVLTAAHCVSSFNPLFGLEVAQNFLIASLKKGDVKAVSPGTVKSVNLRQDTAIVAGDFKLFKKQKFDSNPGSDILANTYKLATCGFPYGGKLVCYSLNGPTKYIDMIGFSDGQMYAGMSGGPVIDLKTGTVYAVNHAIAVGVVIVAPIVNLMEATEELK